MAKRPLSKRGEGQPQYSLVPSQMTLSYSGTIGQGANWMGPFAPLTPVAPPEVAGRSWDYPVGYNIQTQPRAYEPVNFPTLRALADGYDLLRTVIETRKDQIERMDWSIRVKPTDGKNIRFQDARTQAIEDFFHKPDGVNTWASWLRMILEDMFVLDAPTIWIERTVGGKLLALHPIDGATISRKVDAWGRTPTRPQPQVGADGKLRMIMPVAYQQTLKGMPAVDYTADELIYRPRNVRTNRAYGYSPVEQIIMTVNIALRRQLYLLNYYTEGNIPEALVGVPDTWTPSQIAEYQTYFDQLMSGDLAQRRKLKFIPSGVGKTIVPTKEPELKNEFDEWLARIVCFAFSVSPTPFIKQMNRATAGTQKEQADEEGLSPILSWIKSIINDIIAVQLNSPDLEFVWGEDTNVDPATEQTILTAYTNSGQMTLNESREARGLEPYDDPAADMPMIMTSAGLVPLSAYADAQQKASDNAKAAADALAFAASSSAADGAGTDGSANAADVVSGDASAVPVKPTGPAEKADKAHDHKHDHLKPFNKRRGRRLAPIPFDRKATRVAVASMRHRLGIALSKWSVSLVKQVKSALAAQDVAKTVDDDNAATAAAIVNELNFDGLASIANELGIDLSDVATDSINQVIAQLGVTDAGDLVNQVNERAVEMARERAAEMVGMRFDDTGALVPNPDAEWAITDATRDDLRTIIERGLDDNIGIDEIASNIEALGSFSSDRAELIANTEVRRANSDAAVEMYTAARDDLGILTKKEWLLGPNPCEICQGNADQGPIEVDAEFSSGDNAPPAHPRCECAVAPVVEDAPVDGGDTSE